MDIQRLRNLTTGRLHTKMEHIYQDIEMLTGADVFTHQIPNACRAMEPWLRSRVQEHRFWDDVFDQKHVGDYPIEPMTSDEQREFWKRYGQLPSLLAGKQVIVVETEPRHAS